MPASVEAAHESGPTEEGRREPTLCSRREDADLAQTVQLLDVEAAPLGRLGEIERLHVANCSADADRGVWAVKVGL